MTTYATIVAREHIAWAALAGQQPDEILAALGERPRPGPTWQDAQDAVAREWRALRAARRAEAA